MGEKVVGGCLVMMCNSRAGLAFYICDDGEHSGLRVAEATIDAARNLLRRAGYRYFDLGTVSQGRRGQLGPGALQVQVRRDHRRAGALLRCLWGRPR